MLIHIQIFLTFYSGKRRKRYCHSDFETAENKELDDLPPKKVAGSVPRAVASGSSI